MDGSKMHSLQLQFSLIQNEKDRLFNCLNRTVQRAQSLATVPSAASCVLRDNGQLRLLLTEWADAAEQRLSGLYSAPAAPQGSAGAPPLPGHAAGPCSSAREAPPPPGAVRSGPPRAPRSDLDTTLDSAASFCTAAGTGRAGGSAGAPAQHGTVQPASTPSGRSLDSPGPAERSTPDQDHRRPSEGRTVLNAPKASVSKKSSGEVASIINRHLDKKRSSPVSPKSITQRSLTDGVQRPVVFSCHDELTGYTYLNLKEDEPWLAQLTEQLTSLAAHPIRVSRLPRQGELVMSAWQGAWYRAKVTEVFDRGDASSTVALQYVDYGNSEHKPVSEIKFLPDTMKVAPAAAYKCKLTNLTVGGAGHWPLQRLVLHTLAESPDAQLEAVLLPSPLPELYDAVLASRVKVAGAVVTADVAATVNRVLALDPGQAALQAESRSLNLEPLLVPYRQPAAPVSAVTEQPADEKVRSWLAGQTQTAESAAGSTATSRTATAGRQGRRAREIDLSFEPVESRSRLRRCRPPPAYSGLSLLWTARPFQQLPAGTEPHHVLMLHVQDPDLFYVGVRTQLFDAFESRLNAVYDGLPPHPEQAFRHMLPGSYWVARWRADDPQWYRCVVLDDAGAGESGTTPADYPVLWVDYGDTARVAAAAFRPITEEFAAEPLFAIRARCAGVYPVDDLGAPASRYPASSAMVFQELLEARACLALPVPSESTPDCLAVLLEAVVDGEELLSVTSALCELGIAALRQPELDAVFETITERDTAPDGSSSLHDDNSEWDPMAEDFQSAHNRRDVDSSDIGGLAGRDDPGEPAVCPVFARGGNCWDGIACRKKHVRADDQAPLAVPVHVANNERMALPSTGTTVYVKVSAVTSPGQFYVHLPFGAIPAEEVNRNHGAHRRQLEREETLESLSAALQEAYCSSRRHDYSATCLPAPGEVVVAPWEGGWRRGLVTHLTERLQPHKLLVEVFLVDYGVVISCDVTELKEIKKQYNLLPYQAVSSSLGRVAPRGGGGWSTEAARRFVQLTQRPCLLATVLARLPDGRLELDLYGERCQLAQLLVQEGLAVPRPGPAVQPRPLPRQLLPG